jgi:hypothetical protein
MCNRLSHKYGYICDECFSQLLHSTLSIARFMKTDKRDWEYPKIQDRTKELEAEFILH